MSDATVKSTPCEKLTYSDFYDLAEYGNENWKGSFTPREIAINAYDYTVEYQTSIQSGTATYTIAELINLLEQDGSEECEYWLDALKEVG